MVRTLEALDPFQCNPHQGFLDAAARLEGAAIGVNVDVAHRPLDTNAAVRGAPGVGVQDVHKLGIISGKGALVICVLEVGTSRIQTWVEKVERVESVFILIAATLKKDVVDEATKADRKFECVFHLALIAEFLPCAALQNN